MTTTKPPQTRPIQGEYLPSIDGRYRRIPAVQLAMAWWLHSSGKINRYQLRVYFALHEMAERRAFQPRNTPKSFGLRELHRLIGGGGGWPDAGKDLRAALRALERTGLARMREDGLALAQSPDQLRVDDLTAFFEMFNNIPNRHRMVPVPRRTLRALAAGFSRGMTATILGHLITGLFWSRQKAVYRVDGRCKVSWITETFHVSERAVRAARSRLTEMGWLEPMPVSQWQLNRWGQRFRLNPSWGPGAETSGPVDTTASAAVGGGESAPQNRNSAPQSAPPCSKQVSFPNGKLQNQTPTRRADPSGVSIRKSSRKKPTRRARKVHSQAPDLRDVRYQDLRDTGSLLQLHGQAITKGLAKPGEWGRLRFVSLAERSLRRGHDPCRLFAWLLKKQRWDYITDSDEDEANRRIKEHLYPRDRIRSVMPEQSTPPPAPVLSPDGRVAMACIQTVRRHGLSLSPAMLARQQKGWSQERWNAAEAEYLSYTEASRRPTVSHVSEDVLA